jgi:ankyrin repeat protein
MKTIKAIVPNGSAGLMKALVLSMFFVSLLFLSSCANLIDTAKKGDTARVKALIDKGANINAKDKNGRTALMWASEKGYTEIVKLLREKGAIGTIKIDLYLIESAQKGDIAGVNALLNKGADVNAKDKDGWTALMEASNNGHTEIVKALIDKGANINAKDKNGRTALMWASLFGNTEIVKMLLNKGADVNAKDKDGSSALTEALVKGHTEVVKALLKKGANVHVIHIKAASYKKHTEIVKLLMKAMSEKEKGLYTMLLSYSVFNVSNTNITLKDEEGVSYFFKIIPSTKLCDEEGKKITWKNFKQGEYVQLLTDDYETAINIRKGKMSYLLTGDGLVETPYACP